MKKRSTKFARKIRQFNYLTKQLNRLSERGEIQQLSAQKQRQLRQKLQSLYEKVKYVMASSQLQKKLAGAALFLGLSLGTLNAQNFAEAQVNPFGLQTSTDINLPTLVDIDNDGDLDMLTANYDNQTYQAVVKFYENIGTVGTPQFQSPGEDNPFGIDLSGLETDDGFKMDFGDLDGDGDFDMLMGVYGYTTPTFQYFENTGTADNPAFAAPVENPFGLSGISSGYTGLPDLADLDNDGDLDLIAGGYETNIDYFENIGDATNPEFASSIQNPFGFNLNNADYGYLFFDLADVDNDGDLDALGSNTDYYTNDALLFQENTGTATDPSFATLSTDLLSDFQTPELDIFIPVMADLDGDGDIDILLSSYDTDTYNNNWYYFENLGIVDNTNEFWQNAELQLSPNPANDWLNLSFNLEQTSEEVTIQIFDATGRLMKEEQQAAQGLQQFQIDIANFSQGAYWLKIQHGIDFQTLSFLKK